MCSPRPVYTLMWESNESFRCLRAILRCSVLDSTCFQTHHWSIFGSKSNCRAAQMPCNLPNVCKWHFCHQYWQSWGAIVPPQIAKGQKYLSNIKGPWHWFSRSLTPQMLIRGHNNRNNSSYRNISPSQILKVLYTSPHPEIHPIHPYTIHMQHHGATSVYR